MATIKVKIPTIEQVNFTLTIEPEDIPVRGNAMASGNDATDKKYEDEIIERLNNGDLWAWCSVCVTAERKGVEGVDYLGGCCYKDEKDFKEGDSYYKDMQRQAYDDLVKKINTLAD